MFCLNCGVENEEGSKFCSDCGSKLIETKSIDEVEPESVVEPEPEPVIEPEASTLPTKTESPINPFVIIGIIGVILLLGILLFSGDPEPDQNPIRCNTNQVLERGMCVDDKM
tara:strand:+ start:688 stop:1023 length:336 start_codon:yes stop_codon:yes gene_type:complete